MLGLLGLLSPVAASARVSRDFVGMMADGVLFDTSVNLGKEMATMAASGVGTVRVAFQWSQAQPYARWGRVPHNRRLLFTHVRGGVPTNLRFTDRVVGSAAREHLSLLPVVTYAPAWDATATGGHLQPANPRAYARYLTLLVKRYGPRGSFWKANRKLPRLPVTRWEIWNEPELSPNWSTFPFAQSYVSLLRAAHAAIKRTDHSATVVLAALTNNGWGDLASIYQVPGSRKLFDEVAANAYATTPTGVLSVLDRFRQVMDQHGDRHKPMLATELGWPSALGKTGLNFGIDATEAGQARRLSQLLPLLASSRARLRLRAFYYYTWMSADPFGGGPFQFAGLLHLNQRSHRIAPKPAYFAFRTAALKLER